MKLKQRKRVLWQEYKHSRDPISYALYVGCRNDLRRLTRKLRRDFEQSLASCRSCENESEGILAIRLTPG